MTSVKSWTLRDTKNMYQIEELRFVLYLNLHVIHSTSENIYQSFERKRDVSSPFKGSYFLQDSLSNDESKNPSFSGSHPQQEQISKDILLSQMNKNLHFQIKAQRIGRFFAYQENLDDIPLLCKRQRLVPNQRTLSSALHDQALQLF